MTCEACDGGMQVAKAWLELYWRSLKVLALSVGSEAFDRAAVIEHQAWVVRYVGPRVRS